MVKLPDAVTFDFHNTLAECDEWFQLEIRTLMPTFLLWHADNTGDTFEDTLLDESVTRYRALRREIMGHGMEVDAVSCVRIVTSDMGLKFADGTIERGVCEVMRAALADSEPVRGVVDSVRALKNAGVRLGVVSSAAYHPFLEWSLEKFGILNAFDTIVTSASSGFYKSRTEIYTIALAALGSTPGQAVHIGDSHLYDVETPARLGLPAIWYDILNEATSEHMAHAVVTTLEGVDRTICQIYAGITP